MLRAIAQLRVFGGGWDVLVAGSRRVVRSVPIELSGDQTALLSHAAAAGGWLSQADAQRATGWAGGRVAEALDAMLKVRCLRKARKERVCSQLRDARGRPQRNATPFSVGRRVGGRRRARRPPPLLVHRHHRERRRRAAEAAARRGRGATAAVSAQACARPTTKPAA